MKRTVFPLLVLPIAAVVMVLVLLGCGFPAHDFFPDAQPDYTPGTVYTAGVINGTDETTGAPAYWTGKGLTQFSAPKGVVYGINVVPGTVRTVGVVVENNKTLPALWTKWEAETILPMPPGSAYGVARSITVDTNENFYIGGWYNDGNHDVACYWKNATELPTVLPGFNAQVHAIAVASNGTIYTAGQFATTTISDVPVPAYWVGTQMTSLAADENAYGTAESISIVSIDRCYIAGTHNGVASFWTVNLKALERTDLDGVVATSIFAAKGNVYIAGACDTGPGLIPCYWYVTSTGRTRKPLMVGGIATPGRSNSIFVEKDGTIYNAGWYFKDAVFTACIWKNAAHADLRTSACAYEVTVFQ
jgi:hypothetical protein